MSDIPPEVLLGRLRQERLLREAELAALADALKDLRTVVKELSARTTAQIKGVTVDASALISTVEKVLTSPGYAMAERIDTLEAKIEDGEGNASASIVEIRRVIATSEYALAEIDQRLTAKIYDNAATVVTTLTAYATKTYAEAKKTEAITAASADAAAKVLVESSARSSADSANASSISTVSASVGSLSSTVTTNASASVTRDGYLSGKYSLKVAAGNVVTGMNISSTSGGGTDVSEIAFTGSVFKIYNGLSNVVPFTVNTTTNTVTLTNVIVDTLAANISITSPTITGGSIDIGSSYAKSHIDNSGYVLGYGQAQRTEIGYAGTASGVRSYATNFLVSGLTASSSSGVDVGNLFLAFYNLGVLTTSATYGPSGIMNTGGTFGLPSSTIVNLTVTGTLSAPAYAPSSIATSGSIHAGTTLSCAGDCGVTGNIVTYGGLFLGHASGPEVMVYDKNGARILRTRYSSTPATLADVITCLQYHGICA